MSSFVLLPHTYNSDMFCSIQGVVPEGCSEHVYSSLALTLLACFVMDERLVIHVEMTDLN
jgi:hypothetical protein